MCRCSGTTNQIVSQLASDKKLVAELKLINNYEYNKDVLQDIWLQLLETPETKLQDLCNNNKMKFYLISIILRKFGTNDARNNQKYKTNTQLYEGQLENSIQQYDEQNNGSEWNITAINDIVKIELLKISHYDKTIFELVVNSNKTFKQLEEQINIKAYNIFNSFDKTRKRLRLKIKKSNL